MKLFVLSAITLLAALNTAQSAAVSQSTRIEDEFKQFGLEDRLNGLYNNIHDRLEAMTQPFFDVYLKFGQTYGPKMGDLPGGWTFYGKVMNDADSVFNYLKKNYDGNSFQLKKMADILKLTYKYYSPLNLDIFVLDGTISQNPAANKCWDDNKSQIKAEAESVFKKLDAIVAKAFSDLTTKANNSLTNIQAAVAIAVNQTVVAATDEAHLTAFFNTKYPAIVKKLNGMTQDLGSKVESTFTSIINNANSTLKAESVQYQKIKTTILTCVQNA